MVYMPVPMTGGTALPPQSMYRPVSQVAMPGSSMGGRPVISMQAISKTAVPNKVGQPRACVPMAKQTIATSTTSTTYIAQPGATMPMPTTSVVPGGVLVTHAHAVPAPVVPILSQASKVAPNNGMANNMAFHVSSAVLPPVAHAAVPIPHVQTVQSQAQVPAAATGKQAGAAKKMAAPAAVPTRRSGRARSAAK